MSMLRGQDRLKVTVETALAEIERETGLVGFFMLGGPEPRCNGDIMVMSYVISLYGLERLLIALRAHTGKTGGGLDFSKSYNEWKTGIEEPFVAHLNDIFCKDALPAFSYLCIDYLLAHEVCLERALPKRAIRNRPTQPPAESSSLPTRSIIDTAPPKEAAEEETDGSHGPGSMVGAFLLGRKWGLTHSRGAWSKRSKTGMP